MCNKPLVSVVIPVYNTLKGYFTECIASLCGQTFNDWEAILVDDGSNEQTKQYLAEVCALDSRIRLITQVNSGPSISRNVGIRAAQGRYLVFLDSDDYLYPDAIRQLYNAAEETGADLVYGDIVRFEDKPPVATNEALKIKIYAGQAWKNFFDKRFSLGGHSGNPFGGVSVSIGNKFFRLETMHRLNMQLDSTIVCAEDTEWAARYFIDFNSVSIINQSIYAYRSREGSLSNDQSVRWIRNYAHGYARVGQTLRSVSRKAFWRYGHRVMPGCYIYPLCQMVLAPTDISNCEELKIAARQAAKMILATYWYTLKFRAMLALIAILISWTWLISRCYKR